MKRLCILALIGLFAFSSATPARAENGALKLPPFKKIRLNNGVTLLLMQHHEVPIISLNFIVRAGSAGDPAGREGTASATAALLRKGTKSRSADQISNELDFVGGQLATDATFDYSNGTAEFVKKDIARGLDLVADVLLNPTFPQAEVTKLLTQRIDEIKAAKDQAQSVIGNYFRAYLYGSHPYGRPPGGDEKSNAEITRDDVVKFYQTYYTPGNTILAVVGDFEIGEMERTLTTRFGSGKTSAETRVKLKEAPAFVGKKLLLVDKPDSTQTFFQIGNLGIARTNPDRVFVQVINTLFGGRFTSMLNTELRIKTGLTYGARSSFIQHQTPGPFVISTYTRNETTEKAIDMTLEILKRLHEKGVTEEDLKSAKTYLKGQFPPTIETSDQLADLLAQLEFHGLDASDVNGYTTKIDSMTMADAQRVIKQYFPVENLAFVLIGKAGEIEPVVKKYAPTIDRKAIGQPGF
ncbi:MAG TPA: pitrilysin family protein [Blastocatellia bacterium]|nr:pitrilysin family protein [Blastocatellia bacterium]